MNQSENLFFGELLRQFRKRKRLNQRRLAERIEVSRETVSLWERGEYKPEADRILYKIVDVLGLTTQEQQQLFEAYTVTALVTSFHNPPLERNPYFTGRGPQLAQLHKLLMAGKQVALTQAIGGLGGIGKTQLALEYAYRYQKSYHDIFWAVADSYESLMDSYIHLAALLHLPEYKESDQSKAKEAAMRWFRQHTGWLLILDNIEDLSLVQQFVPLDRQGAVLLTTRRQVTEPVAQALELGVLPENDAILFLLKRTKILMFDMVLDDASAHDIAAARAITQALGHLPLALDQAGAYVLETECSFANYLELFQKHQAELLRRRAGQEIPTDHPESVATTFTLNFQQVQQRSKVAAELLRVCAFLAPEGIGEELLVQGASELGPPLRSLGSNGLLLDQAIETLRTFSLIQRDQEKKTLSIHRLVQAVLKDSLHQATRRRWAARVVQAVNAVSPQVKYETSEWCKRLLPHLLECTRSIAVEKIHTREAVLLLNKCAVYLMGDSGYSEAEKLYGEALVFARAVLGPEHPTTIAVLDNLRLLNFSRDRSIWLNDNFRATFLELGGKLSGESFVEADEVDEEGLHTLAASFNVQEDVDQSEHLARWALTAGKNVFEADRLEVAVDWVSLAHLLSALATLYRQQGKGVKADELYQWTQAVYGQVADPKGLRMSLILGHLASFYREQGKYEQAEPLYQRVMEIDAESVLGRGSTGLLVRAHNLVNLIKLYCAWGKCEQAEPLYEQIREIKHGWLRYDEEAHKLIEVEDAASYTLPDDMFVTCLSSFAECHKARGEYYWAEQSYRSALEISEEILISEEISKGKWSPEYLKWYPGYLEKAKLGTAKCVENLANFYYDQGRYAEAEQLFERLLAFDTEKYGADDPKVAYDLHMLALVYHNQGKYAKADPLYARSAVTYTKKRSEDDPVLAPVYSNWGNLYADQGKYAEAELLHKGALAIRERALGPEHPDTAASLYNLALDYLNQDEYDVAEPLLQGALAIREQAYAAGEVSLIDNVVDNLSGLARLYEAQGKYEQAEPLLQRALTHLIDKAERADKEESLYFTWGEYEQAEPMLKRVLAISERMWGPDHSKTAQALHNLAKHYYQHKKYEQAEPLMQRAIAIREQVLGPEHLEKAKSLHNLGLLYYVQGKYTEAEPLLQRARMIMERELESEHGNTTIEQLYLNELKLLGFLYVNLGRPTEAEPLYQRALSIHEQQLGPQHPDTARSLDHLAAFYENQGKCEQAEPLYIRALAIRKRVLGPEDPETGKSLHRLGALYIELSKFTEAEPLLRRSLEIYKETLGLEHPLTLLERVYLANICMELGQYEEAESHYKEALPFYDRLPGGNGYKARRNYASLLRKLGREQEAITLEWDVDSDGTTASEDS